MTGPNLRFLGHSTVRLELAGQVVLTDPVLTTRVGGLTRVRPAPDPGDWRDVDLVLISHLHGDHLHLPSLRLIGRDVRVVVPRGAGHWLERRGFTHVEELDVDGELASGELHVRATRALHSGHRWGPRLTHGPQSEAMGYLLSTPETSVYFAGDTDLYPEMAELAPVDVALLPVWGWGANLGPGHLDPIRASMAVGLLRPRVAVPVHWGTLAVPGLARTSRMRRLLVDPPREFAAGVLAAGHDTRVEIAEPGDSVSIPAPLDRP
ncbi:MAG: Zn-dependent hydrolase of the beta-lactamase fold-like protein [Amycolatopsis sp.]|uniref:MBL fold metallo-hydrolase n=1 Tax=Amycolatopsis sp. TaxID=37632 RepID=UPI002627DF8C|nr:MBL fold metallo-hydrolase [Amycolatopsis sp.]MCU1686029.1 Zn-dependent hydrolase of the beta-lactamase fold-like protein [Amycolatopsis sp.]